MKSLVYGLLTVSLVANVALAWRSRSAATLTEQPAPIASAESSALVAPEAPAAAASARDGSLAGAKPMTWHRATSNADFRALTDELRAAGFPSKAIYAAINAAYQAKIRAADPLANAPFWQQYSREVQQAATEYGRTHRTQLHELLGPDAKLANRINPVERARRYGGLSDDKINALELVESDYSELRSDLNQSLFKRAPSQEEFTAYRQQTELIKQESLADLATVLTPAELEAYEMRNSDTARAVSATVREIDLAEEEFAALYQLKKTFDEAHPRVTGTISGDQYRRRQADQQAMNEQTKILLGDERFYPYLEATDTNYRALTRLSAQFPQVTPAAAYEVTRLQIEVQQIMRTLGSNNRQVGREEIAAAYAGINARLDSLVGPEAAGAIKKQNSGRVFNAPVFRPSASSVPRPGN